jgi:segregation and condensation protein B
VTEPGTTTRAIIEALLFASDEPLTSRRLAELADDVSESLVEDLIAELNVDYLREGRAFRIQEIAGGWRLVSRSEFAPWVRRMLETGRPTRLSQAALETLAIIAYKQPVTRSELESVRGVSVDAVLQTLVDRALVTIVGRGEGLGRPLLYGTSSLFLEYFGLPGLDALPKPEELQVLFADREREVDLDSAESGDEGAGEETPAPESGA